MTYCDINDLLIGF